MWPRLMLEALIMNSIMYIDHVGPALLHDVDSIKPNEFYALLCPVKKKKKKKKI
jgi:hypothetical protein